jgi:hypothetical protein
MWPLHSQNGTLRRLGLYLLAVFIGQSTADFLLYYPPSIGFANGFENIPPCGRNPIDFLTDNVTDFHVGGDALAIYSFGPKATWLLRATLDLTASGNWTTLLPVIAQTGQGDYCEQGITVPVSWAGSKGVLQVIHNTTDGISYEVS